MPGGVFRAWTQFWSKIEVLVHVVHVPVEKIRRIYESQNTTQVWQPDDINDTLSWITSKTPWHQSQQQRFVISPDAIQHFLDSLMRYFTALSCLFKYALDLSKLLLPPPIHFVTLLFFLRINLPDKVQRMAYAFWYVYVGVSAWVGVWSLLLTVPLIKLLLGASVKIVLCPRQIGNHFMSALAIWRLHALKDEYMAKDREDDTTTLSSTEILGMQTDYLFEFGGAFDKTTMPQSKQEVERMKKERKKLKKVTEVKVKEAFKHFLDEHEEEYLDMSGTTPQRANCYMDDKAFRSALTSETRSHTDNQFWSKKRIQGITGNFLANIDKQVKES